MRTYIQREMETRAQTMSRKFMHKLWGKQYCGKTKRVTGHCRHCGLKIMMVLMQDNTYSMFIGTKHFRVHGPIDLSQAAEKKAKVFFTEPDYPLILSSDKPLHRTTLVANICQKFVSLL